MIVGYSWGYLASLGVSRIVMQGTTNKLTSLAVKTAAIGKHFDGGGLFLHVMLGGSRYWRLKYRHGGREKLLALGVFPEVGLAEARDRREKARANLRDGNDPALVRGAKRRENESTAANTFRAVSDAWIDRQQLADTTAAKNRWLLETFLYPTLGSRPVKEITARELLSVLRKIEASGKLETAKRARIKAGQIIRFAILEGLADVDPTASLRGALRTPQVKHHAAVTDPKAIGELLRAIYGFSGHHVTASALKFAPLVFVRPGELRKAEWSEFDLAEAIWRIPAARMKMKAAHLVPLSKQAVVVLQDLHRFTGRGLYVFPSLRSASRPMSENTINAALRRLGYTNEDDRPWLPEHGSYASQRNGMAFGCH